MGHFHYLFHLISNTHEWIMRYVGLGDDDNDDGEDDNDGEWTLHVSALQNVLQQLL